MGIAEKGGYLVGFLRGWVRVVGEGGLTELFLWAFGGGDGCCGRFFSLFGGASR